MRFLKQNKKALGAYISTQINATVLELVDKLDSKSSALKACGFESRWWHHNVFIDKHKFCIMNYKVKSLCYFQVNFKKTVENKVIFTLFINI